MSRNSHGSGQTGAQFPVRPETSLETNRGVLSAVQRIDRRNLTISAIQCIETERH